MSVSGKGSEGEVVITTGHCLLTSNQRPLGEL